MRTAMYGRDIHDVAGGITRGMRILDVQEARGGPLLAPASWDTIVITNTHDTKIVLRLHRYTAAVRVKAIPAKTIDLLQPEPYELEFLPDVPFNVIIEILEILK